MNSSNETYHFALASITDSAMLIERFRENAVHTAKQLALSVTVHETRVVSDGVDDSRWHMWLLVQQPESDEVVNNAIRSLVETLDRSLRAQHGPCGLNRLTLHRGISSGGSVAPEDVPQLIAESPTLEKWQQDAMSKTELSTSATKT